MSSNVVSRPAKIVLLAEDESLTRSTLADALREAQFTVIEAGAADEAMKVLESGVPVDLLITDIQMPGSIDGNALAKLTLKLFPWVKVIVAAGGLPSPEIAGSIHGYFAKPYSPVLVVDGVNTLLSGSRHDDNQAEIA